MASSNTESSAERKARAAAIFVDQRKQEMSLDPKWRAEMLVQLAQTFIDSTTTRNDGDDVQNFAESEDRIVERAVYTLDLILAAVGVPKCDRCVKIADSIARLQKAGT